MNELMKMLLGPHPAVKLWNGNHKKILQAQLSFCKIQAGLNFGCKNWMFSFYNLG